MINWLHHIPILIVVVPLISAPICVLFTFGGKRKAAWLWTLLISWFAFLCSIYLLGHVLDNGEISYHLGSWKPPLGIEYRIDLINAFVLLIVSGISALAISFGRLVVDKEIESDRQILFYTTYLLCLTGLLGVTITGDAFNIFVFLEISSLSSYVLIAMGVRSDRRALTAAYNYLILGTVGATFFVIGLGFLYMVTGTLNIIDLSDRLAHLADNKAVHAGYAFIIIGLALKMALFPMHVWLPNSYTYAPSLVSIFLAATATKVSIYVLLRFLFTVFGFSFDFIPLTLIFIFLPLAVMAIFFGSIGAIYQTNIKRLFAYSSVAQIGYIMIGIALSNTIGLTAAVLHIFNHALIKGAIFMAVGCLVYRVGKLTTKTIRGLGKEMPWTFAALALAGLSLIGIPTTVGFISKWYLLMGIMENGWWPIIPLIVIGSLLAVVYMWKIIEAAYFFPRPSDRAAVKEAPLELLLPLWILVGCNFYFGIQADITIGIANEVAVNFLDNSP
jgi:multicomponent Na+:H+ antiporter subunit D